MTELVVGLDLVEWQLRVAAGEPLAITQDDVRLSGHAIEARLYAEDPATDFLPQTGTLNLLRLPDGPGVRVDAGIAEGQFIGPWYDPMLAKIVAWAPDRDTAIARLDRALAETVVLGVRTNLGFLHRLLVDEEVVAGSLHTGIIAEILDAEAPASPGDRILLTAALAEIADGEERSACHTAALGSLWSAPSGWRLGTPAPRKLRLRTDHGRLVDVEVRGPAAAAAASIDGASAVEAAVRRRPSGGFEFELGGQIVALTTTRCADVRWIALDGATTAVTVVPRTEAAARDGGAGGLADPEIRTPMPGTVSAVHVADGEHVVAGQALVTVEAMKMEHLIHAAAAGVITLHVSTGGTVAARASVATIVADTTPAPQIGAPA